MAKRISEAELILPSLFLMSLNKDGIIATNELISKLREIMRPPSEDLQIISGRNDDYFSQKVRNLKSHSTLKDYGFASHAKGGFRITDKGREYLQTNKEILNYLLVNDFSYFDLADSLREIEKNRNKKREIFDENVIIQEGKKKLVEAAIYQRSSTLRDYAIQHFTENSKISCHCCKFNFRDFYGECGKDFIEIHHIKPIFKYEDENLECILQEAVKNLIPVCSNCHRMIHRNWGKPLEIQKLIESIKANGLRNMVI